MHFVWFLNLQRTDLSCILELTAIRFSFLKSFFCGVNNFGKDSSPTGDMQKRTHETLSFGNEENFEDGGRKSGEEKERRRRNFSMSY